MIRRALIGSSVVLALILGGGSPAVAASGPPALPAPAAQSSTGSDAIEPVVVVLDLSGSMNDDDGSGLIKLTGAKKAVDEVIRSIPSSQPFGLWTYPGGSASCSPGSFAIAPAPISDVNGTIAKVDALTADGGTPTGPALQSTADTLKAQGTKTATLVLVSDGESNCGDNPCDVARQLVLDGFDVTIHAVGFRVSQKGREELNCVAGSTGGTYVDVENGDQLNATLRDLTRAKLRVQVTGSLNPLAGVPARIVATVSNESTIAATDVQVALQFADDIPTHVNMVLRLGNILRGASVQRTWIIDGSRDAALTGRDINAGRKFSVSSWATDADRVTVESAIGSTGADSGGTPMKQYLGDLLKKPIDAGHPLVILGDSYSAGEGTFDYITPPEHVDKKCHRSDKTYLTPALDPGDVINLACSGAVSWDMYHPNVYRMPSQLDQLRDLEQAPGAVVMTLGGNDLGFPDIAKQCVLWTCDSNADQVASWIGLADFLRPWLALVYEDVWKTINLPERRAQRDGAYAPVIVLAYPQVTHATKYGACGRIAATAGVKGTFGPGEVKVANDLEAHLNAAVRAGVADARALGYEIYFVPDTADVTLPNHTLCDGEDAYINDVVGVGAQESVHPNVLGYRAETGAIIGWSSSVTREAPDTSANGPKATEVIGSPPGLPHRVDVSGVVKVNPDVLLLPGDELDVHGSGYQPNTPVGFAIHSTPAVLGTLVADENGEIRGTLHTPDSLELGRHEIIAYGTDSDGGYREDRIRASVIEAPALWVLLGLPAAVLLLLLATIVFGVMWLNTRRSRRPRPRSG